MTVELIQCYGTNAASTADAVCDEHPELKDQYGRMFIAALAQFLWAAELPGVSVRLQRMFTLTF